MFAGYCCFCQASAIAVVLLCCCAAVVLLLLLLLLLLPPLPLPLLFSAAVLCCCYLLLLLVLLWLLLPLLVLLLLLPYYCDQKWRCSHSDATSSVLLQSDSPHHRNQFKGVVPVPSPPVFLSQSIRSRGGVQPCPCSNIHPWRVPSCCPVALQMRAAVLGHAFMTQGFHSSGLFLRCPGQSRAGLASGHCVEQSVQTELASISESLLAASIPPQSEQHGVMHMDCQNILQHEYKWRARTLTQAFGAFWPNLESVERPTETQQGWLGIL